MAGDKCLMDQNCQVNVSSIHMLYHSLLLDTLTVFSYHRFSPKDINSLYCTRHEVYSFAFTYFKTEYKIYILHNV